MHVYDVYNNCILNEGTNGISYCSRILDNIVPSKNHQGIYPLLDDKSTSYSLTSSFDELSFENFNIEDRNYFYTNDDIKFSLDNICSYLEKEDYINDFKITFNKENNSLMLILHAIDDNQRDELDIILDTLPSEFDNELITYLL